MGIESRGTLTLRDELQKGGTEADPWYREEDAGDIPD